MDKNVDLAICLLHRW